MFGFEMWTKPVIVLVPGAWNSTGSFNLLTPILEAAGYRTRCVALPSVGADPPLDDITPDAEAVRIVIQQEADKGLDILLLMHDYASIPGGEAVKSFSKATRLHAGLSGGVTCLFYVAASLLPTGHCFSDMFGPSARPWVVVSKDSKVAIAERPIEIFCPEVEPELAKEYTDSLRPHSYQTFLSKTTWEPYKEIPTFCVFCKLDKVISVEKQKAMAAATGIKFKSSTLITGHCPFVALPEDLAKAVRQAAKERAQYNGVIARDYGFSGISESRT